MEGIKVVKQADVNGLSCNFYSNGSGEFFMTRQQIGESLGYADPQKAIDNLHKAHKDRLDKYSVTLKSRGTDNKLYNTCFYSAKGIYEICRWSRQPKADEFYDHVYEILEGLRLGYLSLNMERQSPVWQDTRVYGIEIRKAETAVINVFIEYAFKNGSKNAKRYYQNYTDMANKAAGIETGKRDEASIDQLNRLSLVENIIAASIQEGIEQGTHYKKIYKVCQERVNQFTEVTYITMKMPSTSIVN